MRSRFVVVLALGLVALADSSAQAQRSHRGEGEAGRYGWLFDLEDGKAQARRTGRPLMVVLRCVP